MFAGESLKRNKRNERLISDDRAAKVSLTIHNLII